MLSSLIPDAGRGNDWTTCKYVWLLVLTKLQLSVQVLLHIKFLYWVGNTAPFVMSPVVKGLANINADLDLGQ